LKLARLGKTSSYRIERELLAIHEPERPLKILERSPERAIVLDTDTAQQEFVAPAGSISELETFLSVASGPFAKNERVREAQQDLASWAVYQGVDTTRDAAIRLPAVASFSKRVRPDAQNLVSVLHSLYTTDREFERQIDSAMRAAFGDEFEKLAFPPDADQRIQLRVRWKSLKREQSAADLSDGTLRFLFLLAVLGSPNPPPLIAIDEPDTGLHPSMLPIVAACATAASERSQVILTTHSPPFLDAFRESTPTITVASSSAGRTNLQVLSGEKLAYWLKHYTLGEIYTTGELEAMER
jgi:predicted ATPase